MPRTEHIAIAIGLFVGIAMYCILYAVFRISDAKKTTERAPLEKGVDFDDLS